MDMIEKLVGELEVEIHRKDQWIRRYGELDYRFETLVNALRQIANLSDDREHRARFIARMALDEVDQ